MRVLVADDDRVMSHLVCRSLRTRGWQADATYDVRATIAAALASPPDVIVLDMHLPDGSARDLVPILKGQAATRQVPIVILTGSAGIDDEAEMLRLGAVAFLRKPIEDMNQFHARLSAIATPRA